MKLEVKMENLKLERKSTIAVLNMLSVFITCYYSEKAIRVFSGQPRMSHHI